MSRGKVTLVTFVWLFSTVCFQMCPQITCPRRCIVTFCFNDIFDFGRPGHSLHVIDKGKQNNVDGVDELNSDGGILWPGARPGRLSVDGKLGVL